MLTLKKIEGHWIIVSDEKSGVDEYCTNGKEIAKVNVLTVDDPNSYLYKKVIASNNPIHNLPKIEIPEEIEVDLLQLSRNSFNKTKAITIKDGLRVPYTIGFQEGFNKSKELYPFSLEDAESIFMAGMNYQKGGWRKDSFENTIKSLSQPKSYEVELETELIGGHKAGGFEGEYIPLKRIPKIEKGKVKLLTWKEK